MPAQMIPVTQQRNTFSGFADSLAQGMAMGLRAKQHKEEGIREAERLKAMREQLDQRRAEHKQKILRDTANIAQIKEEMQMARDLHPSSVTTAKAQASKAKTEARFAPFKAALGLGKTVAETGAAVGLAQQRGAQAEYLGALADKAQAELETQPFREESDRFMNMLQEAPNIPTLFNQMKTNPEQLGFKDDGLIAAMKSMPDLTPSPVNIGEIYGDVYSKLTDPQSRATFVMALLNTNLNAARMGEASGMEPAKVRSIVDEVNDSVMKAFGADPSEIKQKRNLERVGSVLRQLESKSNERLSDSEIDELVSGGYLNKSQAEKAKKYLNSKGSEVAAMIQKNRKVPSTKSKKSSSNFSEHKSGLLKAGATAQTMRLINESEDIKQLIRKRRKEGMPYKVIVDLLTAEE